MAIRKIHQEMKYYDEGMKYCDEGMKYCDLNY